MTPATEQTGYIESAVTIPLADALARWRREAEFGNCNTPHYRCRYFTWGRGQPLVFVHGLSDQACSFVPVIAHLTDVFRCIAYELPNGAGDGAKLGRLKHADLAGELLALLDHLQCGQTCLYGASFGATVVLRALYQQPGRFLRAALQGGFAFHKLGPGEIALASLARFWPGRMSGFPLFRRLQERHDAAAFEHSPPEAWEFQRGNSGQTPVKAFASRVMMIGRTDLRPLLPAIQHSILLISGDRDTVVGRASAAELAARLPHADRLEFANCGHYAQYTHAAGVAVALRRFLLPPCGLSG
jgi:pimeloyl-ACP methyl ester carboxylesterase